MNEQVFARYSFLPWLRQGIATSIKKIDPLGSGGSGQGERASIEIALTINEDTANPISNTVQLLGPGDITGIDSRAVVRTDPRHFITDFEPNYLPLIEFCDGDFPWRYTPATAKFKHLLRPWICLIVLTEDEFERDKTFPGPLPIIELKDPAAGLPKATETWAWAHVHVNDDLGTMGQTGIDQAIANLENLLQENPDIAISRLVCPRKLKPNTTYNAFVIPTFESGRLAGLGQELPEDIDSLEPSWGKGQSSFPVYYEWYFRTGFRGDFESLVRLIQPRVLDEAVGIRPMDVQQPYPQQLDLVPGITEPPTIGLEGALKTPQTASTPWPNPDEYQPDLMRLRNLPVEFQDALANFINLPEDIKEPGATGLDPIVTAPLYGRWHAVVMRLRENGNPPWIEQLNLDPRNRTAAGFGTLVVQKLQEELMNSAWQQLGQIEQVNRLMIQAQLSHEIVLALYTKHFLPLGDSQILGITAPMQRFVLGSPFTIRKLIQDSVLPIASVSRAFRRINRPRGPIELKMDPDSSRQPRPVLNRINRGEITAAPPKQTPKKQLTLEEVSNSLFPSWVPDWLKPFLKFSHLILGLLLVGFILMNVFFNFIPFTSPIFLAIIVASVGAFVYLQNKSSRWRTAEILQRKNLIPELIKKIPPRPHFKITKPGETFPNIGSTRDDSIEAAHFRQATIDAHEMLQALPATPAPLQPLDIASVQGKLLSALHPDNGFVKRFQSRVVIPASYDTKNRTDPCAPIMAAPDFDRPMYEPLLDISPELLIPNVNLIPQNTIALLETNQSFIEAYMVGLNHEMARELLWREYPTDQRGSYFRQFWDVRDFVNTEPGLSPEELAEKLRDIKPIHSWLAQAELGENNNRQLDESKENLVLIIRSDLLKKYPTAVIYAVKAIWPKDGSSRTPGDIEQYPLFRAKIDPDITLIGFALTVEEARGSSNPDDNNPGWFFAIKERPGESRFGLDAAESPADDTATDWNDLSWGHLVSTQREFDELNYIDLETPLHNVADFDSMDWGANAADMAYILFQQPVFFAVHASEMIPE